MSIFVRARYKVLAEVVKPMRVQFVSQQHTVVPLIPAGRLAGMKDGQCEVGRYERRPV